MDRSKIKNYIILLLALVNAFLLYIVLNNVSEAKQALTFRKQALTTVLKNNGITLGPDIELPDKVPSEISLKRDLEKEKKLLSPLLGKCEAQDQGGNIYYYSGEKGQGQFRGTGEFEILLNSGVISAGDDPIAAAKSAMSKLGIACSDLGPILTNDGDNSIVTAYCSWNDTPVYNSKINFYFSDGSLMMISGIRLLDAEYQIASSDNYLDGISVLMKFLESVRQTGNVCSEIDGLEIGYSLSSSISGDCTLKPVWCIKTDSGSYYIDAATGKTENLGADTGTQPNI